MTNDLIPYVAAAASFVQIADGQLVTTSVQVADFFGRRHDNVLKAINGLETSSGFRRLNFEEPA